MDDIFFIWTGSENDLQQSISKINEVHPSIKFDFNPNPNPFLRHDNNENIYRKTFNNTIQKKKSTSNPISIKNQNILKLLNEASPIHKH